VSDWEYPKSEQKKAERLGEFFLTTALWAPYYDSESYETGVRFGGEFRLLQHDGLNWERGHDHVKSQIERGVLFPNLEPWLREDTDHG
jgi:hypothetical protein